MIFKNVWTTVTIIEGEKSPGKMATTYTIKIEICPKNPFPTFIVFRRAFGLFIPRSFLYLFTYWFFKCAKRYFFLFQNGIRAAILWLLKAFHHVYNFYDNSKWWVSQDIWHINRKLLSKIAFKVFLAAVSWPQRHSTRVSGVSDSPTSGIQMFLKEFRRHKSKKMAILQFQDIYLRIGTRIYV